MEDSKASLELRNLHEYAIFRNDFDSTKAIYKPMVQHNGYKSRQSKYEEWAQEFLIYATSLALLKALLA